MKTSHHLLIAIGITCFALLIGGLFVQFSLHMLPCPLCIIQRYAFFAIGLICLVTAFLPRDKTQMGAFLGLLAALAGVGVAIWLLWVQAHPGVSCGIDPIETSLNALPTAKWLPFLFKANGECATEYAPLLGLTVPQWALGWFSGFSLVLGWVVFVRKQ